MADNGRKMDMARADSQDEDSSEWDSDLAFRPLVGRASTPVVVETPPPDIVDLVSPDSSMNVSVLALTTIELSSLDFSTPVDSGSEWLPSSEEEEDEDESSQDSDEPPKKIRKARR